MNTSATNPRCGAGCEAGGEMESPLRSRAGRPAVGIAVHRAPLPVLAAVDVGRSELRLLRGPTVPGVRIALDGRRVREIPCYTGG